MNVLKGGSFSLLVVLVLISSIIGFGCAHVISKDVLGEVDTSITFAQLLADPDAHKGKTILVGRNARENDELTVRIARGNDLWFHVETGSGSHVILRYDRSDGFQDADIVDAAMLALYFSNYRNEKSGDVVYTQRKYIRKPKNKPAGYVTYHNNKTKHILVDQAVLDRLLDSKPEGLRLQR